MKLDIRALLGKIMQPRTMRISNTPPPKFYNPTAQHSLPYVQQMPTQQVKPVQKMQQPIQQYSKYKPNYLEEKILRDNIPLINHVRHTFGDAAPTAMAVLMKENTQLKPHNPNMQGSTADNLWQMTNATWKDFGKGNKYNPVDATLAAKRLYDKRGFKPWEVYNNGSYQKYMGILDYLDNK